MTTALSNMATKAVETWERLGFAPITADTQTSPAPDPAVTGRIKPGVNESNTPKERKVEDVSDRYVDPTPKTTKLVGEEDATHTVDTMADQLHREVTGRAPSTPALQNIPAPKTPEGQEAARAFKAAPTVGSTFDDLMRQGRG